MQGLKIVNDRLLSRQLECSACERDFDEYIKFVYTYMIDLMIRRAYEGPNSETGKRNMHVWKRVYRFSERDVGTRA